MSKTLNVTLSVVVECDNDLAPREIIDHLDFTPTEQDMSVRVVRHEIEDFFEVY